MNTEPITNRCPKCHAPLPTNAPGGLCPKCLLAAASTPTEAGQPAENNPPPPLEAVAAAFPQLQILEVIGQGGMGVVYKARQPHLDRFVALKVLSQSLAADATFAERFNREARVLARLNHPNIVTVHDYGQSNGLFYLLMEYVDGVNLRQAMQAGRFTPQQAMMLVPKICEALQFAHDEGILHRDIKPANILLDTRGRVKIADFGIAKLVGEAKENLTLTASGMAVGTPHYMAPEQLEHPQDVDQRADIYSLGVVFYEMLTGELPIGRFAPPSQKTAVDVSVDEVVFHALEREREKRFRTANEVKTSVEAITAHMAARAAQPAGTAAPRPSSPGAAIPPVRVPCYFNTPKRMRDCFPSAAARIFTCKGELELGVESLTFTSTWRTTITIPLRHIEDLSVGQFQMWTTPWVMKYARINYLAITYREKGQSQVVLLTPVEAGAASASQINDCVGRWFERVRRAASQCAGAIPHASDTASVSVSAEPAWNWKGLPLLFGCLLIGLATWVLQGRVVSPVFWFSSLLIQLVLIMFLLWFCVGFLRANSALWHGALDAVTSDDPPAPEVAVSGGAAFGLGRRPRIRWLIASYVGVAAALLAAILLNGVWVFRNPLLQSSGGRAFSSAPASTARFVLYTMPSLRAPGTPAPTNQLGEWHFKCLVPAHHFARVVFVRWTNGVPSIENSLSAYFEVGNTPLDEDFYVSCDRLDKVTLTGFTNGPSKQALFSVATNGMQWNASLIGHATYATQFPGEPAYRPLETPEILNVRSGHQGVLRLADYVTPEGHGSGERSGVELRIFLEPMKEAPVRSNPLEVAGTDYVAGHGAGWTTDEAIKAINEWPADK